MIITDAKRKQKAKTSYQESKYIDFLFVTSFNQALPFPFSLLVALVVGISSSSIRSSSINSGSMI
jgi:hypothetical protein